MAPVGFRLWACLTVALLSGLGVAGCGASVPGLGSDATADEVLAAARDAMVKVESYRFSIDVSWEQAVAVSDGPVERSPIGLVVDGEWAKDDRYRLTQTYLGLGPSGEPGRPFSYVAVEGRWFLFDTTDEVWQELGFPVLPVPRFRGRPEVPELDEAWLLEDAVLDGVPVYHVAGRRHMTRTSDDGIFSSTMDVKYDLYLGRNDLLLRQTESRLTGVEVTTPPEGAQTERSLQQEETIRLWDFGAPITIELPEDRVELPDPDATPTPLPTATPTPLR